MSNQRNAAKTHDDQLASEDLNPFSFREFLRWKNQDQDPEQDLDQEQTDREEKELGWGRGFQSGTDSTGEEEETRFSSKPEVQQGGAAAGGAGRGAEGRGENYEGDDETAIAEPVSSCRRRSSRSSQIQQLTEDNMSLRRSIMELQRRSEANERRVLDLSEELVQRRRQEEKEAQDLESMVHSVEQNLHLMTKRAVKAENCVSKLKAELQQLQVEVDTLQSENDILKAAESEIVMTMRHNAQVASEYLNKMASHAHSSLRQLMGEAETLSLVSHLLQSIDKISDLDSES